MSPAMRTATFSGITAGTTMLVWLTVGATCAGLGWDSPLRWVASLVGNEPALIVEGQARGAMSAATCITLGLFIHLAAAIALARLFVILTGRLSGWYLPVAGIVYGGAIWTIMTFGLLPVFANVMSVRLQFMPFTFVTAHIVYGVTLAAACSIYRNRTASAKSVVVDNLHQLM